MMLTYQGVVFPLSTYMIDLEGENKQVQYQPQLRIYRAVNKKILFL